MKQQPFTKQPTHTPNPIAYAIPRQRMQGVLGVDCVSASPADWELLSD